MIVKVAFIKINDTLSYLTYIVMNNEVMALDDQIRCESFMNSHTSFSLLDVNLLNECANIYKYYKFICNIAI